MDSLHPISAGIPARKGSAGKRVAEIAARQHGVISASQLAAAGIPSSTVSDWTRSGRLNRLYRGVFAVGHRNLTRYGHWMAAVLATEGVGAVSHTASARLLALDRSSTLGAIHLSVPSGCKRNPPGLIVHRPRSLEPVDLTSRAGIPATSATRTVFDLASHLSPRILRSHYEEAEYLELLERERLSELLSGATGRRGLGILRDLIALRPIPLAETRSNLERIVLTTCRTHSLPLPLVNVPVLDYVVDFLWPAAMFIIEADGGHHRGAQRDRDNKRDATLTRAGYVVRRYSGAALASEAAVAAEIHETLTERIPRPI